MACDIGKAPVRLSSGQLGGAVSAARKWRAVTAVPSSLIPASSVWMEPVRMMPPTFILDHLTSVNPI